MIHILLPFCVLWGIWAVLTGSKVAGFFLALISLPVVGFIALVFL